MDDPADRPDYLFLDKLYVEELHERDLENDDMRAAEKADIDELFNERFNHETDAN